MIDRKVKYLKGETLLEGTILDKITLTDNSKGVPITGYLIEESVTKEVVAVQHYRVKSIINNQ